MLFSTATGIAQSGHGSPSMGSFGERFLPTNPTKSRGYLVALKFRSLMKGWSDGRSRPTIPLRVIGLLYSQTISLAGVTSNTLPWILEQIKRFPLGNTSAPPIIGE